MDKIQKPTYSLGVRMKSYMESFASNKNTRQENVLD